MGIGVEAGSEVLPEALRPWLTYITASGNLVIFLSEFIHQLRSDGDCKNDKTIVEKMVVLENKE